MKDSTILQIFGQKYSHTNEYKYVCTYLGQVKKRIPRFEKYVHCQSIIAIQGAGGTYINYVFSSVFPNDKIIKKVASTIRLIPAGFIAIIFQKFLLGFLFTTGGEQINNTTVVISANRKFFEYKFEFHLKTQTV